MATAAGGSSGRYSDGVFAPPSPKSDAQATAAASAEVVPDAESGSKPISTNATGNGETTAPGSTAGSAPQRRISAVTPQPQATAESRSGAASASLSPTRPAYMQQFTLTTQLILNRMRGGDGGLSSALASAAASTARAAIPSPTYEDVRRRLLDGMSTSTMQMPAVHPTCTALASSAGNSAAVASAAAKTPQRPAGLGPIQKVNAGASTGGKAPAKTATEGKAAGSAKKSRPSIVNNKGPRAGQKRKRAVKIEGGGIDDSSSLSELSGVSDAEGPAAASAAATLSASASASSTPLTTTKSGRQVQKPETYNPAAMDMASTAGSKRRRDAHGGGGNGHGKHRTAEQALCRLCLRLAFTKANQMVFCDGCNEAWHQNCHEPSIDHSFVNDAKKQWHCASCTSKQERRESAQHAKKVKVAVAETPKTHVSWAGRTPGQIRAYLSSLPHTELVELVMHCTSLHPDLAIFPADENSAGPRLGFTHTSAAITNGQTAGASPVAAPAPAAPAPITDGTWDDPAGILEAWKRPKPGFRQPNSLAAKLLALQAQPDAHLEDPDDFEAFSHTVYDGHGRKVEENDTRA